MGKLGDIEFDILSRAKVLVEKNNQAATLAAEHINISIAIDVCRTAGIIKSIDDLNETLFLLKTSNYANVEMISRLVGEVGQLKTLKF